MPTRCVGCARRVPQPTQNTRKGRPSLPVRFKASPKVGLGPRRELNGVVIVDISVRERQRQRRRPADDFAIHVVLGAVAGAHELVLILNTTTDVRESTRVGQSHTSRRGGIEMRDVGNLAAARTKVTLRSPCLQPTMAARQCEGYVPGSMARRSRGACKLR